MNILPSVQFQYHVRTNTNLRASYGRGISLPNFSDIVPSQQVDPNTTPPSVAQGNPALKPTKANNYDVLVEHFSQPLGVPQVGCFYKDLAGPIYPTAVNLTIGPYAGYHSNQAINGPSGHIAGIEMALEQRLSKLPRGLNGLGVSANYRYTTSKVTFPASFGQWNPCGANKSVGDRSPATDRRELSGAEPNSKGARFRDLIAPGLTST